MSDELIAKGPWNVDAWSSNVAVQSADFTHDASLMVFGDFEDREQKLIYAHEICFQLNIADSVRQVGQQTLHRLLNKLSESEDADMREFAMILKQGYTDGI